MNSLGLHGYDFSLYFDKVPIVNSLFIGVVSIDKIPRIIKEKHFLVCNLSPSNKPGSHWIVIVRSEKNTLEVFNSLGVENLDILTPYFHFRNNFDLIFNEQPFQSNNSTSCGFFCIYFIVHRVLNYDMSFEHIIEDIFNINTNINENIVVSFCNKLLNNHENLFD
jgi:hypothetical protein